MPKVFVVNRGAHDYSAAQKYGDLVFCTTGLLHPYSTSQMVREVEAAMASSSPDDYVLLTSLPTLGAVASALFTFKHGCLNLLLFKDGAYVERRIKFDN